MRLTKYLPLGKEKGATIPRRADEDEDDAQTQNDPDEEEISTISTLRRLDTLIPSDYYYDDDDDDDDDDDNEEQQKQAYINNNSGSNSLLTSISHARLLRQEEREQEHATREEEAQQQESHHESESFSSLPTLSTMQLSDRLSSFLTSPSSAGTSNNPLDISDGIMDTTGFFEDSSNHNEEGSLGDLAFDMLYYVDDEDEDKPYELQGNKTAPNRLLSTMSMLLPTPPPPPSYGERGASTSPLPREISFPSPTGSPNGDRRACRKKAAPRNLSEDEEFRAKQEHFLKSMHEETEQVIDNMSQLNFEEPKKKGSKLLSKFGSSARRSRTSKSTHSGSNTSLTPKQERPSKEVYVPPMSLGQADFSSSVFPSLSPKSKHRKKQVAPSPPPTKKKSAIYTPPEPLGNMVPPEELPQEEISCPPPLTAQKVAETAQSPSLGRLVLKDEKIRSRERRTETGGDPPPPTIRRKASMGYDPHYDSLAGPKRNSSISKRPPKRKSAVRPSNFQTERVGL